MEDLLARIKRLERRRIEYFLVAPDNSPEQYARDIREEISALLQEIPLNISTDTKQYLVGKMLNIGPDYEAKCEEQLEQSLRANSTRTDAWLELGQCVWKRGDLIKAHACFKEAVEREQCPPKAHCLLSAALRALSNRNASAADSVQQPQKRVKMLNEALQHCQVALRRRKSYPFAYYSLANTLLARFFALQQSREEDLSLALDAFASALKVPTICGAEELADANASAGHQQQASHCRPFINPDLHLNYGLALYYCQFYAKALAQFRRALTIEPNFGQANKQLDIACTFLCALRYGLSRRGNIARRRLRTIVDTFPPNPSTTAAANIAQQCGIIKPPETATLSPSSSVVCCSSVNDLLLLASSAASRDTASVSAVHGSSSSTPSSPASATTVVSLLTVRCVGFVRNEHTIPSVIICVDRTSAVVALTVYNCSSKFGALIGDTFTVIQPNLLRLRWEELALDECGGRAAGGGQIQLNTSASDDNAQLPQCLLLMRVTNPSRQLLKNGKRLTSQDCAFASMSIETQLTEEQ